MVTRGVGTVRSVAWWTTEHALGRLWMVRACSPSCRPLPSSTILLRARACQTAMFSQCTTHPSSTLQMDVLGALQCICPYSVSVFWLGRPCRSLLCLPAGVVTTFCGGTQACRMLALLQQRGSQQMREATLRLPGYCPSSACKEVVPIDSLQVFCNCSERCDRGMPTTGDVDGRLLSQAVTWFFNAVQ